MKSAPSGQRAADPRAPSEAVDVGAIELLVVLGASVTAHPLPSAGIVSIGRSVDSHVRIDSGSVSRRHAALHVGSSLKIEDLGSANGVRLRHVAATRSATVGDKTERITGQTASNSRSGSKTPPRKAVSFQLGDLITLGSAVLVVRRAEESAGPVASVRPAGGAVVLDEAMQKLHALAERIARGNISVLLLGETGVGKEVLAEELHRRSPRAEKPLLRLNCASLSESLLESELFGHERGAFTGALQTKPGLFETADGGTVFLDEVGELPMSIQIKLLRVLEERKVTRVGGLTPRSVDVRFVAATNRDLEAEVKRGAFRQDLYFRVNGITLDIPPLRARTTEIEPLARLFAARGSASIGREPPALSPATLAVLLRHPWPGNVRELRNVMERAVILCGDDMVLPEHLLLPASSAPEAPVAEVRPSAITVLPGLRGELGNLERERILKALEACAGNQTKASVMLGMPRRTLVTRLNEYGIPRPRKS